MQLKLDHMGPSNLGWTTAKVGRVQVAVKGCMPIRHPGAAKDPEWMSTERQFVQRYSDRRLLFRTERPDRTARTNVRLAWGAGW